MKDHIFDNETDLLTFLKKESEYSLMAELCSLIGINDKNKIVYRQMQNRSKNPEQYFIIDPYDYLLFMKDYKILGIFHSHLIGDEKASEFDKKTSESCCLPFIIYSICTENFYIYEPKYKNYDVNIIERLKELLND
jgi:proteasome lid subunit RPN8/RPN11